MNDQRLAAAINMLAELSPDLPGGALEPMTDATQREIEDYIGDMLQELRELARSSGLKPLAAVLEIAVRDARKGPKTSDGG